MFLNLLMNAGHVINCIKLLIPGFLSLNLTDRLPNELLVHLVVINSKEYRDSKLEFLIIRNHFKQYLLTDTLL